jgi:aerobic carbon-monoxide dehydrogenase small subunit
MSDAHTIEAVVNGRSYRARVPSRRLLSDFIRDDLRLTGTHVGCEHGVCGSCTVLLDGRPVRSCLMFAPQANGASIETIEALATGPDDLHPIQQAFWDHHGLQCGFCTPGMVLTAKALLDEVPNPTDEQIREAISGNVCRCTGYVFIVEAIEAAARMLAANRAVPAAGGEHDG